MKSLILALAGSVVVAGVTVIKLDNPQPETQVVVLNARIWTGDVDNPWAEAMVSSGDSIIYVGPNEGANVREGSTVIDADGRLVVPGFIDSHVHFLTGGANLSSVQLRDAGSPSEFIARIAAFSKTVPAGTWITGGDWDHTNWDGKLPERTWIDSVTAEHPVWVNRLDGHMALANSAALALARVQPDQSDIEGGTVVRDASGHPTGLLKDNAMNLVYRVMPDPTEEMQYKALESASLFVARQGVTSVHDVDGWSSIDLYQKALANGVLKTRIYACAPLSRASSLSRYIAEQGRGDSWISTGCVKGFMDGSLGSHTAAFFDPFDDAPDDRGFLVDSEENLERMMRRADDDGLQLAIHAIGDRAIHIALGIFERIVNDHGPRDRRLRIEHAQHIAPPDIARFAELSVIPSMQPYHTIDDGRWADEVIGAERAKTTYAFRSLLETGAQPAFGSDWFVAPPTPLEGIYAAVTRRTLDELNPGGWVPEQRISVEDALRAYTVNAAYASYEEDIKGSLEVGKLADFVVLDRDITTIPPEEIRNVRVDLTVVGGEVVYERREE
jgi:predicted amidohydrolase YtcJ